MVLVRYLLILSVLWFILWLPISYANASTVQFNTAVPKSELRSTVSSTFTPSVAATATSRATVSIATATATPSATPSRAMRLAIEAPDMVSEGEVVWIGVSIEGAEMADDLHGLQLSVVVTDSGILAPAGDLYPRMGGLFPSQSYTHSVPTSEGWQFLLTAPEAVSGSGRVVELPFYAHDAGCVSLYFAEHLLLNGDLEPMTHEIGEQKRCIQASQTSFTGTVLLDGRTPSAHQGTLVRLNGAQGNSYMTYTSADGSFSFSDIAQDTYVVRLTHPYFLYYVSTLSIFEEPFMPTVTLCPGDMDSEGDIDERDRAILAAGIIPVGFSDYDLNANGQTDVGDLIMLKRNIERRAPADCTSEATQRGHTTPFALTSSQTSEPFALSNLTTQANSLLATIKTTSLTGTLEAVGVRLALPEGVSVTDVELSEPFAGGFLSWHSQDGQLYIVAAPPEDETPTQNSDVVRLHLNLSSTDTPLTLDVEAINRVGWEGELVVVETMSHILHLPLIQR